VSVDDPSRHCNVLVGVFNYNFSTHTPLALAGLATDQLLATSRSAAQAPRRCRRT